MTNSTREVRVRSGSISTEAFSSSSGKEVDGAYQSNRTNCEEHHLIVESDSSEYIDSKYQPLRIDCVGVERESYNRVELKKAT
jgi:hypothetical protein